MGKLLWSSMDTTVSTKSMTQQLRTGGKVGSTVTFSANMKVTLKKEEFLSNPRIKQRLINLLSQVLQKNSCITHHADGDADLLIVKTNVESARKRTTVRYRSTCATVPLHRSGWP